MLSASLPPTMLTQLFLNQQSFLLRNSNRGLHQSPDFKSSQATVDTDDSQYRVLVLDRCFFDLLFGFTSAENLVLKLLVRNLEQSLARWCIARSGGDCWHRFVVLSPHRDALRSRDRSAVWIALTDQQRSAIGRGRKRIACWDGFNK